jgi:hypothetical protein
MSCGNCICLVRMEDQMPWQSFITVPYHISWRYIQQFLSCYTHTGRPTDFNCCYAAAWICLKSWHVYNTLTCSIQHTHMFHSPILYNTLTCSIHLFYTTHSHVPFTCSIQHTHMFHSSVLYNTCTCSIQHTHMFHSPVLYNTRTCSIQHTHLFHTTLTCSI